MPDLPDAELIRRVAVEVMGLRWECIMPISPAECQCPGNERCHSRYKGKPWCYWESAPPDFPNDADAVFGPGGVVSVVKGWPAKQRQRFIGHLMALAMQKTPQGGYVMDWWFEVGPRLVCLAALAAVEGE